MTQAERDHLVALKKAQKKLITQKQAAEELGVTERHVRRLLRALKRRGDKVVAHGLRGLPSNRRISADTEQKAMTILSQPVYRGFGPTLAAEYLANKHGIEVSRETLRQWMIGAKLWRARKQHIEKVHEWRPRRSRVGELVQWDTSDHDWLEGRGDEILLINMIDDATSRWFARFVDSDSTAENMNHLERYLKKHGRPLGYYTDKASLFQTAVKTKRDGTPGDQVRGGSHRTASLRPGSALAPEAARDDHQRPTADSSNILAVESSRQELNSWHSTQRSQAFMSTVTSAG
jgi:biotin operon repressor